MQLTDQLQHNQSFLDFFEKYLRILLNVSSLVIILRSPLWTVNNVPMGFVLKTGILVFKGCCDKVPPTDWFKTTLTFYLIILETRSSKSSC